MTSFTTISLNCFASSVSIKEEKKPMLTTKRSLLTLSQQDLAKLLLGVKLKVMKREVTR